MIKHITWPEFLRMIAGDETGARISERTNTPESTISRWLAGKVEPRPKQVVQIAGAYQADPVQALIAAGYLDESEALSLGSVHRSLQIRDFTDLELAREILRRVEAGGSEILETPFDGEHPAMVERDNVRPMRKARQNTEADELRAVAKPGDTVIEIDEFDD
ncbi:XRE family transcriptional regulator [Cryobacterium sp. Hh11]|uniref:helix-turn-helix domain-containing protein n=1 Tax=Cryobacterium sp. Hh11 TaxID=2555868 RepID=UPI00106D7E8B|nr:helix-turn-helix transcriptional regulator [Cryobacterium sp. Hh11]TFD47612.1 XRE family transcriptional regulator [Cryobacterium sp. Hh11]